MELVKRYIYLDNICGILILNMIFVVHLSSWANFHPQWNETVAHVFSFFMFWFFFKGGMMFHNKPIAESVKKGFQRLVIPYIVFTFIGVAWELYTAIRIGNLNKNWIYIEITTIRDYQCCWTSMACWFLISLFFVRILFQIIYNRTHQLYTITIGLVVALVMNLVSSSNVSFPPYYIGNISLGLAFYSLGFYLKELQFNRFLFILALCIFLLKFILPSHIDFRANTCTGNYVLAVTYGLAGCIVFNNLFKEYVNRNIFIITHIGKISMVYYLVHYPAAKIFQAIEKDFLSSHNETIRYWIIAIFLFFILILSDIIYKYNKKIRFIFGG